MTSVTTSNRPLAGSTKQYLDDLLALDTKTTDQMQRGIREGYLDIEGAMELADKLGVARPRVKRDFRFYFERTSVYTITLSGYTEEEAMREANELHNQNVRRRDVYHGRQTRFRDVQPGSTGPRHRFSALSAQRPELDEPIAPHARNVEQAAQIRSEREGTPQLADQGPERQREVF